MIHIRCGQLEFNLPTRNDEEGKYYYDPV